MWRGMGEPFPSTPAGSPPLWAVRAALLECDVVSSLLICHILLPSVTILMLSSFSYKEVGILPLTPGRRES